jgi:RimJ/RimL family protein N-acetyltransferase
VNVLPPRIDLSGFGLRLREWVDGDLPVMVDLFDDEQTALWTPLASPFDLSAARRYLAAARQARADGRGVQLAVTTDGRRALGEVLLYRAGEEDVEVAYAVGAAYRRRGLATRAVRLVTGYAHDVLGADRVILRINPDNTASRGVAVAAGYRLTEAEPVIRERKGQRVSLLTWVHRAARSAAGSTGSGHDGSMAGSVRVPLAGGPADGETVTVELDPAGRPPLTHHHLGTGGLAHAEIYELEAVSDDGPWVYRWRGPAT